MTITDTAADIVRDLEIQLAANLPGLADQELTDLAVRVHEELEERVGQALSEGLTDLELGEFSDLLDRGDEQRCSQWLQDHRPDYRATTAAVRAELVAEVIGVIVAANPSAADGRRVYARLLVTSLDLVETHFRACGVKFTRLDNHVLRASFCGQEDETPIVVWIEVVGENADLITVTAMAHDVDFPADQYGRVADFAADWNRRTWSPKAVVASDAETSRCRIIAEVALPTGRHVVQEQVDAGLSHALASIFGLFDKVREILSRTSDPEN